MGVSAAHAADRPARGLVTRRLEKTPPVAADAVRVSVFGDGSGARFQVRLLALGKDGVDVGAYWASPSVTISHKGWKTFTFPLSAFAFQSDLNPENAAFPPTPTLAATGVDTLQIAVTSEASRLFLDDLGWTTTGAALTEPVLQSIDSFENLTANAWRAGGDYEQARSVSFGNNKAANYVKNGQGSFQIAVQSPITAERKLNLPVVNARLKARSKTPYVVYSRAAFEIIRPESVPNAAEVTTPARVGLFACAEEVESASVAVYAARDLTNLTVRVVGPFYSESRQSQLPVSAIDVRVVKVWNQAGLGAASEPGEAIATPELLLKDDRQPLLGPMPDVRLTGDPVTSVPAQTAKQFWVTVHVPKRQSPSKYTGNLVFSADGVSPTSVPFTVEVLPMPLRTAFLQYGIDLRSRLSARDAAPGEPVVNQQTFAAQLADIRDHGFRFVSLYEKPGDNLDAALKLYAAADLSANGPIVLTAPIRDKRDLENIEKNREKFGLRPDMEFYYRLPDADAASPELASSYAKRIREVNRAAQILAPTPSTQVFNALGKSLDIPLYSVSSDYAQRLLATGKRETSNRDWWTWDISREDPIRNRLLTGFLLYRTGSQSSPLYGAFPGPYQFNPNPAVDPFDETSSGAQASVAASASAQTTANGATRVIAATDDGNLASPTAPLVLRPQMTTYPAVNGVIDTLQWEAAREGIDDIRYIGALKRYIRDLKDAKVRKDATDAADAFLATRLQKDPTTLSPAEHQALRRAIVEQSLKLLTILRGSVRGYTG